MKVLITGTTQGIGRAIAVKFLAEGHTVMGIDRQEGSIHHPAYTHYVCDIRDYEHLPALNGIEILINNAGTQNEADIDTNLKALIHMTETYGIQPAIKSILHIGSASAHTGSISRHMNRQIHLFTNVSSFVERVPFTNIIHVPRRLVNQHFACVHTKAPSFAGRGRRAHISGTYGTAGARSAPRSRYGS